MVVAVASSTKPRMIFLANILESPWLLSCCMSFRFVCGLVDVTGITESTPCRNNGILVGWSYAGYIISDYVRRKGQDKIAGINFVAAAVVLGPKAFGSLLGPGFLENAPGACQNDLPTNIAAVRRFLRACVVKPVSQDDFEEILAFNMFVKPNVRSALVQRELDFASLLEGITVPVLVTHGRSDTVVLPAMADYILNHCKTAKVSWYEDVGHAPFLEEPLRFNTELKRFAVSAHH